MTVSLACKVWILVWVWIPLRLSGYNHFGYHTACFPDFLKVTGVDNFFPTIVNACDTVFPYLFKLIDINLYCLLIDYVDKFVMTHFMLAVIGDSMAIIMPNVLGFIMINMNIIIALRMKINFLIAIFILKAQFIKPVSFMGFGAKCGTGFMFR